MRLCRSGPTPAHPAGLVPPFLRLARDYTIQGGRLRGRTGGGPSSLPAMTKMVRGRAEFF